MSQNEFSETIYFKDVQEILPDYFRPQDLNNMESALSKWNRVKTSNKSPEEIFKKENFSYEEISGFALWKASTFYAQCPTQVKGTEEKIFLGILNRYIQHYLDLAGKR